MIITDRYNSGREIVEDVDFTADDYYVELLTSGLNYASEPGESQNIIARDDTVIVCNPWQSVKCGDRCKLLITDFCNVECGEDCEIETYKTSHTENYTITLNAKNGLKLANDEFFVYNNDKLVSTPDNIFPFFVYNDANFPELMFTLDNWNDYNKDNVALEDIIDNRSKIVTKEWLNNFSEFTESEKKYEKMWELIEMVELVKTQTEKMTQKIDELIEIVKSEEI